MPPLRVTEPPDNIAIMKPKNFGFHLERHITRKPAIADEQGPKLPTNVAAMSNVRQCLVLGRSE